VDEDAPDTQELLTRVRGGEQAALEALFARHRERLRYGIGAGVRAGCAVSKTRGISATYPRANASKSISHYPPRTSG
jgi:hypothetical protein